MAIKKYVAIAYCFAFLAVYLASLAYGMLSSYSNENFDTSLPQTQAMNATSMALSSFSGGWSGILLIVGIIVIIFVIISFVTSVRSMGAAI